VLINWPAIRRRSYLQSSHWRFLICSGEYNAQRFVEFLFQLFELTAGGISKDEAQGIAANLAKVPEVLWKSGNA
jgi:hypothetical protein